jgi:uncharacterized protein (DUF488 family)
MNLVVYTIGHSTHEINIFLELLMKHSITCVIDVRTDPLSVRSPQFNKESLRKSLEEKNIVYLHFPKSFGARHKESSLLDESGKVDFNKVRQSKDFREGINKLIYCLEKGFSVALMCAEANPLNCHRFGLISYQLVREGIYVKHIMKDGALLDNTQLEEMLIREYSAKIANRSLFESSSEVKSPLEMAYEFKNNEIGFIPEKTVQSQSRL